MQGWLILAAEDGGSSIFGGNSLLLLLVLYAFILWFVVFRPQRKAQRARKEDLKALSKNDTVLTSGGLIGIVVDLREDEVTLRVDDKTGTRIRFHRESIVRRIHKTGGKEEKTDSRKKEGAASS